MRLNGDGYALGEYALTRRGLGSSSAFHHFEPRVKLMAALRTAKTIPLNADLFHAHAHAATVGIPSQMRLLLVNGLIALATQAITRLSVQFPRTASLVHFR